MDEATIIDILTKRTNAQRQQIKAAYQQTKGKVKYVQAKLKFTPRISTLLLAEMVRTALASENKKLQLLPSVVCGDHDRIIVTSNCVASVEPLNTVLTSQLFGCTRDPLYY